MKKLIILVLFAAAAWYGWKHYPDLLAHRSGHEAVIENQSGHTLERVRLAVGGQKFVKETLDDGERATFSFRVAQEASFDLTWQWKDRIGEMSWSGGMVPRGPMQQRHIMTIDGEGGVVYQAENK
jgi:hypothetical protein